MRVSVLFLAIATGLVYGQESIDGTENDENQSGGLNGILPGIGLDEISNVPAFASALSQVAVSLTNNPARLASAVSHWASGINAEYAEASTTISNPASLSPALTSFILNYATDAAHLASVLSADPAGASAAFTSFSLNEEERLDNLAVLFGAGHDNNDNDNSLGDDDGDFTTSTLTSGTSTSTVTDTMSTSASNTDSTKTTGTTGTTGTTKTGSSTVASNTGSSTTSKSVAMSNAAAMPTNYALQAVGGLVGVGLAVLGAL